MTRHEHSIAARNMMGDDFFGGWEDSDVDIFRRFAVSAEPMRGKITDFLGVRTSTEFHPWAAHYDNIVLADLPLPDDSLRAEAIEYFALFDSLVKAPTNSFSMAEIGASYAPWTCAAAVCGRRMGKSDLRLSAVEASSFLFSLIPVHLSENEIDASTVTLVNGAAATERTQLFFPKVSSPGDNGGQASSQNIDNDYLDRPVEYESVEAYPLASLLPEGMIDLVHIDVQGHEYDVLSSAREVLQKRVRAVFVGTHSRKIEGLLLELFHSMGWELVRERPTKFHYASDHKDIVAWTTRDGGQYWRNVALG